MQIFVTGGTDLRGPSRKSPTLQASLGLLVASTYRDVVPEGQFRVWGYRACGVDELQIADEAAADNVEVGVVDGRCRELIRGQ